MRLIGILFIAAEVKIKIRIVRIEINCFGIEKNPDNPKLVRIVKDPVRKLTKKISKEEMAHWFGYNFEKQKGKGTDTGVSIDRLGGQEV